MVIFKPLKEPAVFMTELVQNQQLLGRFLFFQNFENHSYIPEPGLWCFENPKSPRNARGRSCFWWPPNTEKYCLILFYHVYSPWPVQCFPTKTGWCLSYTLCTHIMPCYAVGEVPIRVDSPQGGSHEGEGVPDWWRTHEYGNLHVHKNLFFFFPQFFPFCFLKKNSQSVPFLIMFLNFPDSSHQKIIPWEHGNVEI